ncbi:MAG: Rieske 2Fe-2S domain-containing protein [Myxococcales bacterium]|nr:Rieske 2Fe-2S domain-containing protein [Myxococcales bacterium]
MHDPPADWRDVGPVADLPLNEPVGVVVALGATAELKLALIRREEGVCAVLDRCPHRGAPFSDLGLVDDEGHLVCGWHYWAFRLSDGEHAHVPGVRLACFPVRVNAGRVEVDVSKRALG